MTRLLVRAAAIFALGHAVSAAAQTTPGPPPAPGPAQDVMNPYGTPRGMEAGDTTTEGDLLARRARESAVDRSAGKVRGVAATAADIVPGNGVNDSRGKSVGTIESITAEGAVVVTGAGKVMVPLDAFGKNKKGLMLAVTKAEFDAAVASATAAK